MKRHKRVGEVLVTITGNVIQVTAAVVLAMIETQGLSITAAIVMTHVMITEHIITGKSTTVTMETGHLMTTETTIG